MSWIRFEPRELAHEPGHEDEVVLEEVLDVVLEKLEPLHRQIVTLTLVGESVKNVADQVQRTERTVRRVLERFRAMLCEQLRD